jgi:DNA-binding transcriptional ArsR family regulator
MSRQNQLIEDPRAMRALAHPARLAILKRLQVEGPATATECAGVVGVSPSACSYHLRMLAKYGFVEDAPPRGDGRERLWQAMHRGFTIEEPDELTPEVAEANSALLRTVVSGHVDDLLRYSASRHRESKEWRQAAMLHQLTLLANADELADLGRRVAEILEPYLARERTSQQAPPDARLIQGVIHLFPRVGGTAGGGDEGS